MPGTYTWHLLFLQTIPWERCGFLHLLEAQTRAQRHSGTSSRNYGKYSEKAESVSQSATIPNHTPLSCSPETKQWSALSISSSGLGHWVSVNAGIPYKFSFSHSLQVPLWTPLLPPSISVAALDPVTCVFDSLQCGNVMSSGPLHGPGQGMPWGHFTKRLFLLAQVCLLSPLLSSNCCLYVQLETTVNSS